MPQYTERALEMVAWNQTTGADLPYGFKVIERTEVTSDEHDTVHRVIFTDTVGEPGRFWKMTYRFNNRFADVADVSDAVEVFAHPIAGVEYEESQA